MTGALWGLRQAAERGRLVRAATAAALAIAVTAAVASAERLGAPLRAPTRTLHALFGVIVPLFSIAMVGQALGGRRLAESTWSIARYGWSRRWVALGVLFPPLAVAVATAVIASAVGLVIAYAGHGGLMEDLRITLPLAALLGWSYFGYLALGASFMRCGRGRWIALVVDAVFGATSGVMALPFPRGYGRNLIGGEPVLDLGQGASSAVLAALALSFTVAAVARAGR